MQALLDALTILRDDNLLSLDDAFGLATDAYVATIGVFDGVHRGHLYLLDAVKRVAAERGLKSMAVTFDPHPAAVTGKATPQLLTTTEEKCSLLRSIGIDCCVVWPFTSATAAMTASEFMRILHSRLGVRTLVMGHDHRFGCEQRSDADFYRQEGLGCGLDIIRAERYGEVSSTVVRQALSDGNVERAAELLGRPYSLEGTVVDGYKMGRKLGFPTANIDVPHSKLLPKEGVYAVRVWIGTDSQPHKGMLNIGPCPTFEGKNERHPEVHILDFEGDIYHETLRTELLIRLRDEQKFGSVDELICQLKSDVINVRNIDIS